jgi:hypothetical protein
MKKTQLLTIPSLNDVRDVIKDAAFVEGVFVTLPSSAACFRDSRQRLCIWVDSQIKFKRVLVKASKRLNFWITNADSDVEVQINKDRQVTEL